MPKLGRIQDNLRYIPYVGDIGLSGQRSTFSYKASSYNAILTGGE